MSEGVVLVVGAGPGVGAAVARRFASEGLAVGLISRSGDRLEALAEELRAEGATVGWAACDLTDAAALSEAVDGLAGKLGPLRAVHFNPSVFRPRDPLHLSVEDLLEDVAVGVGALLTTVRAARPHLSEGARITATGSMAADRPSHEAASLGVQKAGLRNLVRSIDATLSADGIRAVSVTVRGVLSPDDESSPLHPAQVAEAVFRAAHQPADSWATEVGHPTP